MTTIEKIRAEIDKLYDEYKDKFLKYRDSYHLGLFDGLEMAKRVLFTLETETTYDTQQYTPRPSVGIEDVARVQFASHARVFDKKRKAVFDWEQFKEVAGIFYGFGKKDTLESEKPINPDDAMKELEEKIALVKQRGTWDGVDVDKYMDEVRGREPEKPMNKDCNDCPHCVDRKDQYGWHFKGCFGGPYKGKFIAEIDECPLKKEQPEVDSEKPMDLEEEINLWISENENIHHGDKLMVGLLKDVARHFAKWGAEHLKK